MGIVTIGELKFSSLKSASLYANGLIGLGQSLVNTLHGAREAYEEGQDIAVRIEKIQVGEDLFVDELVPEKIDAAMEALRERIAAEEADRNARQEAAVQAVRDQIAEAEYRAKVAMADVLLVAGLIDAAKHEETVSALRAVEVKEEESSGQLTVDS